MGPARQWNAPLVGRWLRWLIIFVVLVTYVAPGLFSSYRAWVQVRSLDLIVPHRDLRIGDTIRVNTVSWARTVLRPTTIRDSSRSGRIAIRNCDRLWTRQEPLCKSCRIDRGRHARRFANIGPRVRWGFS